LSHLDAISVAEDKKTALRLLASYLLERESWTFLRDK
jgi:hypothetical protein